MRPKQIPLHIYVCMYIIQTVLPINKYTFVWIRRCNTAGLFKWNKKQPNLELSYFVMNKMKLFYFISKVETFYCCWLFFLICLGLNYHQANNFNDYYYINVQKVNTSQNADTNYTTSFVLLYGKFGELLLTILTTHCDCSCVTQQEATTILTIFYVHFSTLLAYHFLFRIWR